MAGQPPPQGPEDDFFDQFFSMAAGGSYPATAGGGRAPGDQPFSLALSLDAAAAEASGSGKHADGGKVDREAVQLPGLFPPVFSGGVQPPHLRPNPPTQVFHAQQPKQGGAGVGPQPPAPRPKVRARRGQATDPHSIAERLRRERIAERMRALQELVPNTNKTDRAVMLDEILDYVKFLRLQVKVLSMSRLGGAGAVAQLVADIPLSVKDLPDDIRVAQEKKLEELKRQQELQNQLAVQRTLQLRDRKIKFFERRKIERMIRRLEKQQRSNGDGFSNNLSTLREDLEYVRFFPKNEKYVSLFSGGNSQDIVQERNKWRKQIKDNLMAAAANGKDLEETASDDDTLDVSDDDFFVSGSSSDEEADDEWTDKSAKEPASSASGRAASGMSSDEKNQRQRDARVLMPPPRSLAPNRARHADKRVISSSSNTSNSTSGESFKNRRVPNHPGDNNSNLSSNSDAHKPRRKRRHKKKKKLA